MALQLYTHPMSPCSQKIRIILAEKGLAWERIDVDLPAKENLSADYLKLNPLGVVPTLVEDGKPVIESSIIAEYLEDKYPSPSLRPADPYAVAQMRYWMKHVDNKVHPSCGALQWPLVMADKLRRLTVEEQDRIIDRVPEKPRRERQRRLLKQGYDAPDIIDAVGIYEKTFRDLDELLSGQAWIAGSEFFARRCGHGAVLSDTLSVRLERLVQHSGERCRLVRSLSSARFVSSGRGG